MEELQCIEFAGNVDALRRRWGDGGRALSILKTPLCIRAHLISSPGLQSEASRLTSLGQILDGGVAEHDGYGYRAAEAGSVNPPTDYVLARFHFQAVLEGPSRKSLAGILMTAAHPDESDRRAWVPVVYLRFYRGEIRPARTDFSINWGPSLDWIKALARE